VGVAFLLPDNGQRSFFWRLAVLGAFAWLYCLLHIKLRATSASNWPRSDCGSFSIKLSICSFKLQNSAQLENQYVFSRNKTTAY
jgi:hypothetical protein